MQPLLGAAIKAFLRTTVGMVVLALVMLGVSFYLAAEGSVVRGVLAALLALVTCGVFGVTLATKRAAGVALARGLEKAKLGQRGLELVFRRMLGVDDEGTHGDRGGKVARTAENIPLATAEQKLTDAVSELIAAPQKGGGLRGRLQRRLLDSLLTRIQTVTLAELRSADQQGDGVDLIRVRDKLTGRVDELLLSQASGALRKVTVMLVAAAVVLSCAGALAIRQLPL